MVDSNMKTRLFCNVLKIYWLHCCVNQPYWLKKNSSLLSYKEIYFKTLKKNALAKEFSLLIKGKSFRDKRPKGFSFSCYSIFY